jgi:hypothetical protein
MNYSINDYDFADRMLLLACCKVYWLMSNLRDQKVLESIREMKNGIPSI